MASIGASRLKVSSWEKAERIRREMEEGKTIQSISALTACRPRNGR